MRHYRRTGIMRPKRFPVARLILWHIINRTS